jgi:hypothetical protein
MKTILKKEKYFILFITVLVGFLVICGILKNLMAERAGKATLDVEKFQTNFVNKPVEQLTPEEKLINRSYIKEMIKTKGEKEEISFLIKLLKNPKTCYLPREALVNIGIPAINYLRKVLKDKKNNYITRTEALKALRDIGDKKAYLLIEDEIKPISFVYRPEEYEFQRTYLQMKLEGLTEIEKIETLIEMLKDKNKSTLAREALIEIGTTTVPYLIDVLEDKKNPFISRLDALWSLKEIEDKRCIPTVIKILEDSTETDHLRELAAYTLGELREESAIPVLEKIIETWKPEPKTGIYNVAETAKKALEKILKEKESP